MAGDDSGNDDLTERRDALRSQVAAREAAQAEQEAKHKRVSMAGYAVAFRLSTELVAGIVVGGVLGYLLDRWLNASPLFLIVFLLLGFTAGVLNVLRSAGLMRTPQPRNGTDGED